MSKSFYFILNPISGTSTEIERIRTLVQNYMNTKTYTLLETKYKGHASELAKKAVEHAIDVVVAIGGDGTVNEIASELIDTQTSLAVLPKGSGNGFARNLTIPMNMESALKRILNGEKKCVDTGVLNKRPFVGVTGTGFDAYISKLFDKRQVRGFLSYIKLSLKEYVSYQPKLYQVTIDDQEFTKSAFLITVGKSRQYGNNAQIIPCAELSDGKLHVGISKKIPLFYTPLFIYQLFTGTLERSTFISYASGKKIRIVSDDSMIFHLDGEPVDVGKEAEIIIKPKSLYVIC